MAYENQYLLGKQNHKWLNIICIFGLITSFVVAQVFNAKAGQSIGIVSGKYDLDITPASWTFSIWVSYTLLNLFPINNPVNI